MFGSTLGDVPVTLDWEFANEAREVRVVIVWVGGGPVNAEAFSDDQRTRWEEEIREALHA